MRVTRDSILGLQKKLFLRIGLNGTGFTVRHYLPNYLPSCGATFAIKTLVQSILLPTPHEDSKWFFIKFVSTRWKRILKIGFRTNVLYLLLITHIKFDSRIFKTRLAVSFCYGTCNNSARRAQINYSYASNNRQYAEKLFIARRIRAKEQLRKIEEQQETLV